MSQHRPEGHGHAHHSAEPLDDRKYWLDEPRNVTLLLRAFFAACAVLLLLDFVVHRHIEHSWENLPAFHPIWGYIGVIVLVFTAKALRKVVMRPEGYYDNA